MSKVELSAWLSCQLNSFHVSFLSVTFDKFPWNETHCLVELQLVSSLAALAGVTVFLCLCIFLILCLGLLRNLAPSVQTEFFFLLIVFRRCRIVSLSMRALSWNYFIFIDMRKQGRLYSRWLWKTFVYCRPNKITPLRALYFLITFPFVTPLGSSADDLWLCLYACIKL